MLCVKVPPRRRIARFFAFAVLSGILSFAIPATVLAFSDVPSDHPYAAPVEQLARCGAVEGYPDGTFRPEHQAWRQHFTKMLLISLGIAPTEADTCPFSDVDVGGLDTLYPDNYIAVAANRGIVRGVGEDRFAPTAAVLRAQAVTMVIRALQALHPDILEEPEASFRSTWGDFSVDHADNARLAEANGLLDGLGRDAAHPGGNLIGLDSWAPMSRGELALLLANMLDLVKENSSPPPPTDLVALHDPDACMLADYNTCLSGGCHQLNLMTQHVSGAGLGCDTCHSTAAPAEVGAAIEAWQTTGTKQGCRVCHGLTAGDHQQLHELSRPEPTECTSCHVRNLLELHELAGGAATCTRCHGDQAPVSVQQVVAKFADRSDNPRCTDCHTQGTYHAGLPQIHTAQESGDCGSCHLLVLPDEHGRSTSSSSSGGCSTCHPLVASFDWTGLCADCHGSSGVAPIRHLAEATAHQAGASGCLDSGCHQTDVSVVHQSTAQGCSTCHSSSEVPTTTDCISCHGEGQHYVREPFKNTCDRCHSIGGPGQALHDRHATDENEPCATCHGPSAPGCVSAACHEHTLQQIHSKDDHWPCTACHLGGPPSGGVGPERGSG